MNWDKRLPMCTPVQDHRVQKTQFFSGVCSHGTQKHVFGGIMRDCSPEKALGGQINTKDLKPTGPEIYRKLE